MTKVSTEKKELAEKIVQALGPIVTRKQVLAFVKSNGGAVADVRFIFNNKNFRAGRGQYDLSSLNGVEATNTSVVGAPVVSA